MSNLPPGISLRPAAAADEPVIRALIRAEGLNPFSLHWKNFLLAVNPQGGIVGIGAVKTHGDGSRELASIAVVPSFRGRGIASTLIRALMEREASSGAGDSRGPLYLMCRESMAAFYERFGFRRIGGVEMSPYFRRMVRIFGTAVRVIHAGSGPVIMRKDPHR